MCIHVPLRAPAPCSFVNISHAYSHGRWIRLVYHVRIDFGAQVSGRAFHALFVHAEAETKPILDRVAFW